MDFPPILILVILWLFIGLPLSKLNKSAKQQMKRTVKHEKQESSAPDPAPADSRKPAAPSVAEPVRPTVLQPSITFTEHDDSVYQGSMNAETGEGYDPCHEEQLSSLSRAETAVPAAEAAEPGLQLNWTGNEIVRGFVMSEILKRR